MGNSYNWCSSEGNYPSKPVLVKLEDCEYRLEKAPLTFLALKQELKNKFAISFPDYDLLGATNEPIIYEGDYIHETAQDVDEVVLTL